ncbi:hypothetical protein [Thermococcus sp.]|uniref:hypothetical protein n=1 Tax=Thermococcus sp. TaxID=35749 RepID=UPI0026277969|nr:hypothetical protein [Thermococcus sp.]
MQVGDSGHIMRELWYRVGIVVFILVALVLKTAPVLGNYTNAGAGFSVVGTRIGWEENYAGDFGTTVYYFFLLKASSFRAGM